MIELKLGAATLNQTPLDWKGNFDRISSVIQQAREADVSLLCLPELCITGYGCEDIFLAPYLHRQALLILKKIIPLTRDITVAVGLPVLFDDHVYNCVAVISDKQLHGFIPKQNLANSGVYYEHRWFKPWKRHERTFMSFGKRKVPFGDYVFFKENIGFGFEICEDAWIKDRAIKSFRQKNVRIILNPSASHFSFHKLKTRLKIVNESSHHIKGAYVYANLHGLESGRLIFDGGAMISSKGLLQAMTERFSYSEICLCTHILSLKGTPTSHSSDMGVLYIPSPWKPVKNKSVQGLSLPSFEKSKEIKKEEFTRALGVGMFDYLRKSQNRRFVISLSGGIDSSACLLLIHYMVHFMALSLGKEAFSRYWRNHFPDLPEHTDISEIMKRLVICTYQKTDQSSRQTEFAAFSLSKALNATYYQVNVEPIISSYIKTAEKLLRQKLNWTDHDLPLQNIQARARSPMVWLLTNLHQGLLLTTSNRSEAAVGYATMDGDTSGGLAPLGGIDKHFLRNWMHWVALKGPANLHPVKEVTHVLKIPPTAELRPVKFKQQDEKDLMPYDLLNEIEILAIRDKKSPQEVLDILSADKRFKHMPHLTAFIKKFFRLWSQNQWKRERYAPSFHLDDQNLDPKTWCRFPILSGSFKEELLSL